MVGNVTLNVYIHWSTLKLSIKDPLELLDALFLIPSSHTIKKAVKALDATPH